MDSINTSRMVQTPIPVQRVEPAATRTGGNSNTVSWRSLFPGEQRQKVIIKIIESLKHFLPSSGQDGKPNPELESIAVRFEDKIYSAAISKADYLHRISAKLMSMSRHPGNTEAIQPHALPPVRSFTRAATPHVVCQTSSMQNLQNISGIAQNSMANSLGPDIPSNTLGSSQRQMQQSKQQAFPQQQQPHFQNQQHHLYQQQLPNRRLGSVQTSRMQSEIQQQQQQQQPSMLQSAQQNPSSSVQKSTQSMLQQPPQQVRQQPQHAPIVPSQQASTPRQVRMVTAEQQPIQQTATALLQTQGQSQKLVGLQQQTNPLQREMGQRLQTSIMSGQQQNLVNQQKQLSQPEVSSTSSDSKSQAGIAQGDDWKAEVYQKIKTMKEMYVAGLFGLYQKIAAKLQQYNSLPNQPNHDQLKNLKFHKALLERLIHFLRRKENEIQLSDRENVVIFEQQIMKILNSSRISSQRGHIPQPNMHAMQHKQQPESQNSQMQPHENQMNPQLVNLQGPVIEAQQNNRSNMQHNAMFSASNTSSPDQYVINTPQRSSNSDLAHGNLLTSLQQVSTPSLQQNSASDPQKMNTKQFGIQIQMNAVQPKQQEGKMSQTQQLKQQLPGQVHNQFLHSQQQQDRHRQQQQQKQPQPAQLPAHRMSHHHQSLKSGAPLAISTLQGVPAASPEVSQKSSPQIDQQNNMVSRRQSSSSPLIVPSPSSLLHAGNVGNQQTTVGSAQTRCLEFGTPGISVSPLLSDFTSPDGTNGLASTIVSPQPSDLEQPHEHLMRLVKTISARALSEAVSDIGSVVHAFDRIAGSAPGNDSRTAIGDDVAAMTNCRQLAGNVHTHHQISGTREMRRFLSATGPENDNFNHSGGAEASNSESTATSSIKRRRVEDNNALVEEIQKINRGLIDTVVVLGDQEFSSSAVAAAGKGCEGAIVKCFFSPVAFSPNLNSPNAFVKLPLIQPLQLLVPDIYPHCSPIFLDKLSAEISNKSEDLSMKVKTRFSISLRSLSEPMSLGEIARTWDVCARAVISEYAQQNGGGSFSSKYGNWESCFE